MIKKNHLLYVHNLRGLAILIIVAIHSRMTFLGGDYNSTLNKNLIVFLDNGTIIFVFISGFLFHHVFIKNLDYKKYLVNKSKYVLLPYLLASIIPIADKLFFDNNIPWLTPELDKLGSFGLFFYMLISGKQFGPFWFIPMITIFYILSPILVRLNNQKFYSTIFPILFIGGLFTYQFGYYSTILDSFVFYLPIYLLGMLISQYKLKIFRHQRWLLPTLVVLYVGLVMLELKEILVAPKLAGFSNKNLTYFIFNPAKFRFTLLSIILLILFQKFSFFRFKILRILGDYSFGIYFIHLFFIILIQKIYQFSRVELPKSLISFLLLTFVTVCLSVLFVWVIKIIFKDKSRFVIGS